MKNIKLICYQLPLKIYISLLLYSPVYLFAQTTSQAQRLKLKDSALGTTNGEIDPISMGSTILKQGVLFLIAIITLATIFICAKDIIKKVNEVRAQDGQWGDVISSIIGSVLVLVIVLALMGLAYYVVSTI